MAPQSYLPKTITLTFSGYSFFFVAALFKVSFTCHTTHLFKVYNLVGFTRFSGLYNHQHILVPEHLSHQIRNPTPVSSHSHSPLYHRLITTNLLSISLDLHNLDFSYKWNEKIRGLLCLALFKTKHNVFKVHSCCSMCWYFITFYD